MDILAHLMQEHRKVEAIIADLQSTEPGDQRDQLIDELSDSLFTHMAVEEQFLYPIVVEVADQETETEAEVEHDLTREGLAKLDELRAEPGFGAALDMVKAGIAHHVNEEENEVFPKLKSRASDRLAQLDPEQLEIKAKANATSRDELYRQAREAGVAGRSSMTKDQLAEAVSGTSGS